MRFQSSRYGGNTEEISDAVTGAGTEGALAVIPARGGSKRLAGKNIRTFHGAPLIAWTIRAAKATFDVGKIVVSTDDDAIRRVALEEGAEVPFQRPPGLSSDSASTASVIQHTTTFMRDAGHLFNLVVTLQPTSPLRSTVHIAEAIRLARARTADSVISVQQPKTPPTWLFEESPDGWLRKPKWTLPDGQMWLPNGAIYVSRAELALKGDLYGTRICPYPMPAESSIDIDTELDFMMAERIAELAA